MVLGCDIIQQTVEIMGRPGWKVWEKNYSEHKIDKEKAHNWMFSPCMIFRVCKINYYRTETKSKTHTYTPSKNVAGHEQDNAANEQANEAK
jgi:hypothetical protein